MYKAQRQTVKRREAIEQAQIKLTIMLFATIIGMAVALAVWSIQNV